MARSSKPALTQRINTALLLLRKYRSSVKAAELLAQRYRVSVRQASRYIREAKKTKAVLPIPERKVVFTVKLPLSLVQSLRERASTGESLSALVTHAIQTFLQKGRHG